MVDLDSQQSITPPSIGVKQHALFILHVANTVEQRYLESWLAERQSDESSLETVVIGLRSDAGGEREFCDRITGLDGDTQLCPVRTVWLPDGGEGANKPRVRDLFLGDMQRMGALRARLRLKRKPDTVQCVEGEPATIKDMRDRFAELHEPQGEGEDQLFARYIAQQAELALDMAERRLRGSRYKVPRFVSQSIQRSSRYIEAIALLSAETGRSIDELNREAATYLKEMVAKPRKFYIDMTGKTSSFMASLGYEDRIVYDNDRMQEIKSLVQNNPSVLLWTHKSHVDGSAVMSVTYDQDFPTFHSFGGINMAFAGVGFMSRRSGVIFIRRSFQDNPVYKLVLRQYLGFLMAKRFPFSWAFEGTRSRVGKLMPPKLGLLKYVVEAAQATDARNLHLIPVSISYDLIGDVEDHAVEQTGVAKSAESLSWFVNYLQRLRKPMGRIYLNFGTPVVVEDPSLIDESVDLHRLSFEVAVNVNQVTPISLPSVMSMVLLGAAPQALTVAELDREAKAIIDWARARGINLTSSFDLQNDQRLEELTRIMVKRGVVTRYDQGLDTVYGISPDRHAVAGYYRNTTIHFFVTKAILELSMIRASESAGESAVEVLWQESLWVRDLFKFEFFYHPTDQFQEELLAELSGVDPQWREKFSSREEILALMSRMGPLVTHSTLVHYLEAYSVVAHVMELKVEGDVVGQREIVTKSLKYARQAYLQRHISSEASIGKQLFSNAYQWFESQGLSNVCQENLQQRRDTAHRLRELLIRARSIATIAAMGRDQ